MCWSRSTWARAAAASDEPPCWPWRSRRATCRASTSPACRPITARSSTPAAARNAPVCRDAARIAASYAQLLRESGIACDTITGGGTGSVEFDAASGVYTELQAGSYAFMDGDYGANEWGGPLTFQHSLFLLSTVMSTPAPDRAVLDAG